MSEIVATVVVKGENGKALIINESDYDEKKYELLNKKKEVSFDREPLITFLESKNVAVAKNISDKKLKALYEETKKALSVAEKDGVFTIVDGDGNQVGEESYTSNEEAETMLKIFTGK